MWLYKNADWENSSRGGKTCRHEKAKDLLGKLIAKQGDQIRCLGRGRVAVEDAIGRTTRAPGAYL